MSSIKLSTTLPVLPGKGRIKASVTTPKVSDGGERAMTPVPVFAGLQAFSGVRFGITNATPITQVTPADKASVAAPPDRISLSDFISLVKADPHRFLPKSKGYIVSAVESFGYEEKEILGEKIKVYNFPNRPYLPDGLQDKDEFVGQELVIHKTIEKLKDLKDSRAPYIIQYVGPYGTGKSHLVTVMDEAVSQFSEDKPEGKRYSFSFIFAKKGTNGVSMLFPSPEQSTKPAGDAPQSKLGAKLPKESQINFKLPSAMGVNPLFLLSIKERSDLIQTLKASGKIGKSENFDFFINGGGLDERSKRVLDALKRHYDGDINKVFENHILVEKRPYNSTMIPSEESPFATVRQLTPEIQWNKLPAAMRNIGGLLDYSGPFVRANGNMINLDDMARAGSSYNHLLTYAQTGRITVSSPPGQDNVEEPADITVFATDNPETAMGLVKNNRALKERIITIIIPRERRFMNEVKIHQSLFAKTQAAGRHIAPNVQETYALWATMTRLLPMDKGYKEYDKVVDSSKFKDALGKVDLLRKALLYQGDVDVNSFITDPTAKEFISPQEHELLKTNLKLIANEYMQSVGEVNYADYEAAFGAPEREGDKIIVPNILNNRPDKPLTVMDVFESLGKYIKTEPAWLLERKMYMEQSKKSAPSPLDLLKQVEDHSRRQFVNQVKEAIQIYQPDSVYIKTMGNYLEHVRAHIHSDDPSLSQVRPGFRSPESRIEPNIEMIQNLEKILYPDKQDNVRVRERDKLLARMQWGNGWEEDSKQIAKLFANELKQLRVHDDKNTGEKKIEQFRKDLSKSLTSPDQLEKDRRDDIDRAKQIAVMEQARKALLAKGYHEKSLPELLDWAFSKNYISDGTLGRSAS